MGVGDTSTAVLLTADRLSAELDLSEKMAKAFKSFLKAQKTNKQIKKNNQQTVTAFAQIFSIIFYLESWAWALKRKSVSKRIMFTQAWVMVLE